jgi:hypothetical protein
MKWSEDDILKSFTQLNMQVRNLVQATEQLPR